jgi:large subunit ribosomal protein L3
MNVPKHKDFSNMQFDDLRLIVHTNPKITSLPKKKPEIFELSLGGTKDEKLAFAKEKLGKEIDVTEALKLNELVDIHAVTKGKGFQGPVKRFGVQIRSHKSEKSIRNPASLGAWNAQHHIMYRVAHAGQTGYHTRTELNKPVILIANDPSKINPLNGFGRYGNVKTSYIAVLGSIPGPKKRMIRLVHAIRPDAKMKLKAEKLQLLKISQIVQ